MNDEDELQELLDKWLNHIVQKDAKACAACYTEDSWILSSYGEKAHGSTEIAKIMQNWIDSGAKNKKIITMEMSVDGDLAYSLVSYSEDYDNDDGTIFTETGIAVNVFKRQTDGSWKYRVSMLKSDNASSE